MLTLAEEEEELAALASLTGLESKKSREIQLIKPQPGPQQDFLSSAADIAIYGGAAGAGKTWAMLLEPLRWIQNPAFAAVIFRRNTTHIRNPGGLWDESMKLYPSTRGIPNSSTLEWKWGKGGKIKMAHLEYEQTKLEWQGAQIPLIIFDELTHFTKTQFFYLMSRNRSMCGIKPYIRASCNPDSDSWVAALIDWWIDSDTGYPIPERSGKLRWFIVIDDTTLWADSREELITKYGNKDLPPDHESQPHPKSLTFIPGKLTDNPLLMQADPGYIANLKALSMVEQERLLHGNWKIRPSSGLYFKRKDAKMVYSIDPSQVLQKVRRWDLAATEVSETNPNPDWTVGVLMARLKDGRSVVLDVVRERIRANEVRALVRRTAERDGRDVWIGLPQDPGQAGKDQISSYAAMLIGFRVKIIRETGDKVTRAEPFAAQWQAGNVDYIEAEWNTSFLVELEQFPDSKSKDDQVDAAAGAFAMLEKKGTAPAVGGARDYV